MTRSQEWDEKKVGVGGGERVARTAGGAVVTTNQVHILDPLHHSDLSLLSCLSLPPHAGQVDVGREEQEEPDQSQERNDESGQVQAGLGSVAWGAVRGGGAVPGEHFGLTSFFYHLVFLLFC